ncbi:MAG TPA: lysophospholipid acyltransferase family protein [Spirochaetia bacterium]
MSEPGTPQLSFRKPRLVNRLFYRVMTGLLRGVILHYFKLEPVNAAVVPPKGPALILSNHSTLFDPIWVYAMLHRPVYFAATEELFRKRALGRLITWLGAFPKRKAATDMAALRTIFSIADKGELVGIFPEGVRSWDGTNQPLYHGIAKLIRRLQVPVYVCRLEGAYLVYPRWARRWRRMPVRGVFSELYTAASIPGDDEKILTDIATAIRTPDFDVPLTPPRRRQAGLAVNVTKLLYRCPSCGTMEGLKLVRPFSTNRIECSSCFSTWVIDSACRLSLADENGNPEGTWRPLPVYYKHIAAMPFTPIRTEIRLGLAPEERIVLISRPRFLFRADTLPDIRALAFGRAFLTTERLVFRTRFGIALTAPLASIGALSVDPGDKLHFTTGGRLYRMAFRNESALKWFDCIHRLQDEARTRMVAG